MPAAVPSRVSVHVACRDRPAELALLLASFARQTHQAFDVAVLDDASETPLLQLHALRLVLAQLATEGHRLHFLRTGTSGGVCEARNRLLADDPWAENPYVLRVDDDSWCEPDYLERLVALLDAERTLGLVGGLVPLLGEPAAPLPVVPEVMNRIVFDLRGDIITYADDCGVRYARAEIRPAHRLRSSFLLRRLLVARDGLRYEDGLSPVGFREEDFFCLRAAWKGWSIAVDTGALAWHLQSPTGGCRWPNYTQLALLDHGRFLAWASAQYRAHGPPPGIAVDRR